MIQDRAPEDENIRIVFIHELYLIQSIIKVTEANTGLIGNKRLVRHWQLMNRTAMDYLREHHRLLRILDEGREEEEDLAESLHTLIIREYGQALNAPMELVTKLMDDFNNNDNLEKHLSQSSLRSMPVSLMCQKPTWRKLSSHAIKA